MSIILYMRPKGTAKELEQRRKRAVALLSKGRGVCEVARMVNSSASSVVRWRDAHKKGGLKALKSKPTPGRPAKLSQKQCEKLISLLRKGPKSAGYKINSWTIEGVRTLIWKRFRVRYHRSQVWRILKAMGIV